MLTRYEMARLVGIRALQLSEGYEPHVFITDERLRRDAVYVAALELYEKKMDACVVRRGVSKHVSMLSNPLDLVTMLNTRDGGERVYGSSGISSTARTSSVYDARDGTTSSSSMGKSCLSRDEREGRSSLTPSMEKS